MKKEQKQLGNIAHNWFAMDGARVGCLVCLSS
jgi:hypothetical protein